MPVVAITGSTGKTTTKDLIHAGIAGSAASKRSFNNEIGVPLTILAAPEDATVLIVEVGSRGKGHIEWLRDAIRPDIAVITNLGVVHMETFGTPQGLADAKFELVEMLDDDGIAVLPSGEPLLAGRRNHGVVSFGTDDGADVQIRTVAIAADGTTAFEANVGDWSGTVQLSVAGLHQAANAAAALGVASALGLDLERFATRIAEETGSDWRMQVHEGDVTIVNDAYNANPQSVASALATVAAMGRRAIAVLGPMAELGPLCEQEHRRMGEIAADLNYAAVIVVGVDHGYALGAHDLVVKASGTSNATDTLRSIVEHGDIILVKASRSAGLEQLALQLVKESIL
jgi:UDP-N-acetylmuramoyl-tripeptide--D-alanyl-D-alanine ligase